MRRWVFCFACVLVLGSPSAFFGQEPSGPRTLENLLKSDDAEQSAAPAEANGIDAGPKRPEGTVSRPKDGVQHPDLDKAWADYDAAVAKAAERIKAAISKQFDAATAKGDLDPAEKWQLALEKFEKAGEVPADTEARAAVNAAVADYNKAKDKLFEAYEDVVKSLTMEKKIAEAKAARNEKATLGKVLEAFIGVAAGRRTPKSSKMNEATRRQKILAAFIGSWINDGNRDHQLIRADGQYIVNGNPANEWSGTWTLDMEDPEGPCIVRVANNRTKTRFYLHPENPNILMFSDGLMRRQ
jgi:hypothetical protein